MITCTTYYRVQWNAEYKVLQCLPHNGRACPAAEAMEGRTPEEISEQALIQHYVGQGVDLATAERVVYGKGLPPVDEYTPVAESPRPFSLLK
jgi:hypothetical protein